jgi:hypothetical protein
VKLLGRVFFVASIFGITLLTFSCVSSPVRWYLKEPSAWRVAVVDKTVPHRDFREHGALYWVLRHDKIGSPQGARDWDLAQHYVGFAPTPDDPDQRGEGVDLTSADLANAHMLFLADTYGVYEGDYLDAEEAAALDYSPLIYGGLSATEAEIVREFADEQGGHLIAEFNTFASPTSGVARRQMEELLGLRWSGWTGRYFRDLSDDAEVPAWAPRLYREQYDVEWEFDGPGYLLVHEDSSPFVLREGHEIERNGLRIRVRAGGAMMDGVLDGMAFKYWFDIVSAPEAVVPAMFEMSLTESGHERIAEFGVPAVFPAVVVNSQEPLRAYFAGDFSDAGGSLGPYWLEGLPWLNRRLLSVWFPRTADQEPFYWGFYIPLLRNVFAAVEP